MHRWTKIDGVDVLWPKEGEFAPGIPDRAILPIRDVPKDGPNEVWVLGVEHHKAHRAGSHYDLRLVDPKDGVAHSWALPRAEWPKPGEKVRLARTFTHDVDYALRKGEWIIPSGLYGAGKVKKIMLEPVEVVKADNRIIRFNRYGPGQKVEELSIIQTPRGDYLYNHTMTKDPGLPKSRGKYKDTTFDKIQVDDEGELIQAKIDGAHALVVLPKSGKPARVFSIRRSKRTGMPIEHTFRFKDWHKAETPGGYGGVVLRAELYAVDKRGRALPPQQIAGLLNTNVWNARIAQEEKGIRLKLAPFDVVKWKGKIVEQLPYREKMKLLKEISDKLPEWVELPPTAWSKEEKRRLLTKIRKGQLKETKEGVVIRRLDEPAPPVRAKLTEERDAKIVGFTEGRGRLTGRGIGGFIVEDEITGARSVVGAGLSEKLREAAKKNPNLFKGMVIKVRVQEVFPKGTYRAPRFVGFHLDKNDPDRLAKVTNL